MRIGCVLAVGCAVLAGNAVAQVLPNPEAGTPLTGQWMLVVILLLLFGLINTIVGKLTVAAVNRALAKKDQSDLEQNKRISALDEKQREQELRYREEIHKLQLELLKCQKEYCMRAEQWVTKEEHHGDILRVMQEIRVDMKELKSGLGDIHRRVDGFADGRMAGESA